MNFRLLKNSDIAPPTTAPGVDPQLHANLVKLFELSGDRERIEGALPQVLKDAGAKMGQVLPGSNPAYFEEWAKRMASRLKVQDLLDEEVRVYERHFTSDEIAELLAVQVARKESKPAEVSTQLRQKIVSETPAIQRETNTGRQELFARVGAQIADEILKEHPEYKLRKSVASPSPPPSWHSPEEADITYRTLVDRAKGGDFSVDFRVLRLACVKSNLCQPRSKPQELLEMQRAQPKQAIELAERLIDRGFVNFEAHAECSRLYRDAGDEPKAIFHLQVATALAGSILGTGDGKTKETAFEVISDREVYVALTSLGLPYAGSDVLSNSRMTDGGHHYDKWSVRNAKTSEVVEVFFNTDYFSPTKSGAQP